MPESTHGENSFEAKGLVRSFSDRLEADGDKETIAMALVQKEGKDKQKDQEIVRQNRDWLDLLQRSNTGLPGTPSGIPDEQKQLYLASQKLAASWQRFLKKLPAEQRLTVSERPDFQTLQNAVAQAQSNLADRRQNTRRGRFRESVNSMIGKCEDYSTLLAIIPDNDKYTSLVTGSISAFAKAAVNHDNIANSIFRALEDIEVEIDFWKRRMVNHKGNSYMRKYIIDLFVLVFELYTDIFTKWSSSGWDRIKNSFDKNFLDRTVSSKISDMRRLGNNLDREAGITVESALFQIKTEVTEINKKTEQFRLGVLGLSTQSMLRDQADKHVASITEVAMPPPALNMPVKKQAMHTLAAAPRPTVSAIAAPISSATREIPAEDVPLSTSATSERIDRDGFEATIRLLSQYLGEDVVNGPNRSLSNLELSVTIVQALDRWASGSGKKFLWLEGPFDVASPSQNARTAASLVLSAKRANIPVISYFVGEAVQKRESERDLFLSFVYSLIAQLGRYVSLDSVKAVDKSFAGHFKALDGTKASVADAVAVLKSLINARPELMFCIIDGVQILEDRRDARRTELLREVLSTLAPQQQPTLKACFTTDGHVKSLAELKALDRIDHFEFEHESGEVIGEDEEEVDEFDLHND